MMSIGIDPSLTATGYANEHGDTFTVTYPKAVIDDWYGEGEPNNPRMMFLSHRGADGAFAIEFRN